MELRHLRYFIAVGEELSFRKAAQRLSVSRPALSKQIRDLEAELSVKLLERDTVKVSLTKAGELFLEDSQRLLLETERAVKRAQEAQSGHRGKIRIGSLGILATEFLPKTLKVFHQKYPSVEVEFVEMLQKEQLRALPTGKIDIGFAYGDAIKNRPDLSSLCVVHSIFGVAVSRQHPLAARRNVTLKDLRWETLLCVGGVEKTTHYETISRIYSAEGIKPSRSRSIDGFDSMVTLIAADQGVSILPQVLDLANQDVTIIPLHVVRADLDFHIWAVWNAASESYHVKHFIELLDERGRPSQPSLLEASPQSESSNELAS